MEYKEYIIEGDGAFGMKVIKQTGSGAIPVLLRGHFTNEITAMKQIDLYLSHKEVKNGKEASAGRG
jgi:hypothetical protein